MQSHARCTLHPCGYMTSISKCLNKVRCEISVYPPARDADPIACDVLCLIPQVLVYHDMLGMLQHPHHAQFVPRFCKNYASVGEEVPSRTSEFAYLCPGALSLFSPKWLTLWEFYPLTAGLDDCTNVLELTRIGGRDFPTEQYASLVYSISLFDKILLLLTHWSLRCALRFMAKITRKRTHDSNGFSCTIGR